MKNKIKSFLLLTLILFIMIVTTSCDGKTPEDGYVTDQYIYENIILNFDDSFVPTKYSYTATLNYLGVEAEELPKEISKSKLDFIDSPDKYSKSCSSYFLRVPMRITKENWILYDEKGNYDITNSTKYVLESKIYQPNGGYLDTIYYYPRENGGFYLKAFGVNKSLKIDRPTIIEPNAKWNIVIEYDENGYLVSETFQTLNAFKDPDSKTIYGKTVYKYE